MAFIDILIAAWEGLIQYRERKIQWHDFLFPVIEVNKDGADLGSENS